MDAAPADERGLVRLEARNVLLRRTRAFEKLLLLGLEPVPRRDDLRISSCADSPAYKIISAALKVRPG